MSFLIGLLLVTGACSTVSDPDPITLRKYGAVTVQAKHNADGSASASTSAIFFSAYSATIPDSHNPPNFCQYSIVDTTTSLAVGTLAAGSSLALVFGAGTRQLTSVLPYDMAHMRYVSAANTNYVGGDSLRVAIPGDATGFPASTISVRLAEPLSPQPVALPAPGSPMTVRWNASPDTSSAIVISLMYANPATSTYPNEQIICALKDDGSEEFSAVALGPVLASPAAMRSLRLTRWRTQVVTPGTAALLHIVSSIDTLIKLQ